MTGNALGYIETIGLPVAIEAADSALKAANVKLIGYELAKGDGMTTVKIEGDVGAVKAAVAAAATAAGRIGTVVSTHVIPRPAEGTEKMSRSRDTVGIAKKGIQAALKPAPPPEAPPPQASPPEALPQPMPVQEDLATTIPEGEVKKKNQHKKGSGKTGEPELNMP